VPLGGQLVDQSAASGPRWKRCALKLGLCPHPEPSHSRNSSATWIGDDTEDVPVLRLNSCSCGVRADCCPDTGCVDATLILAQLTTSACLLSQCKTTKRIWSGLRYCLTRKQRGAATAERLKTSIERCMGRVVSIMTSANPQRLRVPHGGVLLLSNQGRSMSGIQTGGQACAATG